MWICLTWFFTSQSTFFQLCRDGSSWVEQVLSKDIICILLKDTTQWRRWSSYPRPYASSLVVFRALQFFTESFEYDQRDTVAYKYKLRWEKIIQPVSFCWIIPYMLKQSYNFQKEFSMTMELPILHYKWWSIKLNILNKKLRKLCLCFICMLFTCGGNKEYYYYYDKRSKHFKTWLSK